MSIHHVSLLPPLILAKINSERYKGIKGYNETTKHLNHVVTSLTKRTILTYINKTTLHFGKLYNTEIKHVKFWIFSACDVYLKTLYLIMRNV